MYLEKNLIVENKKSQPKYDTIQEFKADHISGSQALSPLCYLLPQTLHVQTCFKGDCIEGICLVNFKTIISCKY